jgi:nucleotide-binding universal stress UspA family protein
MAAGGARSQAGWMFTYEDSPRLICGVDDSEHAVDVVALASQLADRLGLLLHVVHSAHPDIYMTGPKRDAVLAEGAAFLSDLAPDVAEEDRVVGLGHPVDLVHSALTENGVMAVVGSRGLGAARTALLGSVSRSLASLAPCPVVIVPPQASVKLGRSPTIICGVDGSEGSNFALDHAVALAFALSGRVTAVNVGPGPRVLLSGAPWGARPDLAVDDGRAALGAVEGAAARLGVEIPIRLRIERGEPVARLRAVAAEYASAILVVGSQGQSGLLGGLGSTSSHLAANAPAPVMVIPAGIGPGAVRLWAPRHEHAGETLRNGAAAG